MYGYVYLTINTVSGMKYIGKHKGEQFDPNYYGSGILLTEDMKHYSLDVYERTVLCWCETLEELNSKEIEYIKKHDAVNNAEYFNLSAGGDGGSLPASLMSPERSKQKSERISKALKGHTESAETRQRIGIKHKQLWEDPEFRKRRKESDDAKWKDQVCIENHIQGIHKYWEQHKEERYEQMSTSAQLRWESDEYREKQHKTRASEEYKNNMKLKLEGKTKGYKTLHKEDKQVKIPPEQVSKYLSEGWKLGCKPFSDEHRRKLSHKSSNKSTHDKYIYCIELDKIFSSIAEAARELKLSEHFVKKALEHNISVNGYTLIWKEED